MFAGASSYGPTHWWWNCSGYLERTLSHYAGEPVSSEYAIGTPLHRHPSFILAAVNDHPEGLPAWWIHLCVNVILPSRRAQSSRPEIHGSATTAFPTKALCQASGFYARYVELGLRVALNQDHAIGAPRQPAIGNVLRLVLWASAVSLFRVSIRTKSFARSSIFIEMPFSCRWYKLSATSCVVHVISAFDFYFSASQALVWLVWLCTSLLSAHLLAGWPQLFHKAAQHGS